MRDIQKYLLYEYIFISYLILFEFLVLLREMY